MSLVQTFVDLLQPFSLIMTVPTFNTFLTVVSGWVFARRHTVTGMILAAGAVGTKHHSAFHRLFSAARWSLDEVGLAVADLLLSGNGAAAGTMAMLALDDTLCR